MKNPLSKKPVCPREVVDPDEKAYVASTVRASVLSTLPGPSPFGSALDYNERALHAELTVDRALDTSRFAIVDTPGHFAGRFGARSGVVLVVNHKALPPRHTHDRIGGALVSGWGDLWCPPRTFRAPQLASAPLRVPHTLAELHDQFVANIEVLDHDNVLVTGDVVVPPLYGACALTLHIPQDVQVRALALCAGHNTFVEASPEVLSRRTPQLTAA